MSMSESTRLCVLIALQMYGRLQREDLVAALRYMQQKEWVGEDDPLYGLCDGLEEHAEGGLEHSLTLLATERASLHMGSTLIKCKKGHEGARQDCMVFMAFSRGAGQPAELCIMEVQAICKVDGVYTDAQGTLQEVHKKFAFGQTATCSILKDDHRCNMYSDGPGAQPDGVAGGVGACDVVHMLPSVLQPVEGREQFTYVVELKNVQASAMVGKLGGKCVYMPYVPMSSHA